MKRIRSEFVRKEIVILTLMQRFDSLIILSILRRISMQVGMLSSVCLAITSCAEQSQVSTSEKSTVQTQEIQTNDSIENQTSKPMEERVGLDQLVNIQTVNSSIRVDLKYASSDNFMKKRLYFDIDRLYLQKDVALRLSKCQQFLKQLHPEYSLLVYDGVRPLSVQRAMWEALDSIPVAERGKFVSNPANGSIHNYGAAVDLTICDQHGIPLDMGAGYDDIREIAYPSKEAYYLSTGELTAEQVENRKLLRKVMQSQQFRNIPTEWWHFNACSRAEAKMKFKILE